MPLAHDLITEAAAALDYDSYVQQPDGSLLTQSSARDTIVHMCQMLELEPGLRVLEVGTGSGYTSALLGRILGEQGSVVSLDVDSSLTERARIKHAQGGVGNVAVQTADGYRGWAAGAPYDRIIGWAAPHLLPRAWVEQATDRAVIVTPVTVAPIAQAHLLLRVDLHHGQPIPRDVHAGGFIEMCPEVITEVAVPIRHRDALHLLDDRGAVWISALTVRDDPERARHAAQMIAAGHSVPSPFATTTRHAARSTATSTPGDPMAWLPPDSAASVPAAPRASASCSPTPQQSFDLGTWSSPAPGRPKNRSAP